MSCIDALMRALCACKKMAIRIFDTCKMIAIRACGTCKKIAIASFGILKKIAITALGPLLDYGLYYYDLYSDTYFSYTLAHNCHWIYFTSSVGILVSSYIITVGYLRCHFQVIWIFIIKPTLYHVRAASVNFWQPRPSWWWPHQQCAAARPWGCFSRGWPKT